MKLILMKLDLYFITDTAALEARVTTLETTDTAALEARVTTLETKMLNVIDFTFDRLCTILEYVSPPTVGNQYICCANKDIGKLYCADGTSQADIFDIDFGTTGQGVCDESGTGKSWICQT